VAVGKATFAGDDCRQYRPQESPGNSQITYRAGDAGDILPDVATEDRSWPTPIC
jgi:hypothetical protein